MTTTINASTSAGLVQTADTSGNLSLQSGGTTILALTSAGAAVTGTLGVTGKITKTNTAATLSNFFTASGSTTGAAYLDITNTSGAISVGIDNSVGGASSAFWSSGGSAYAGAILATTQLNLGLTGGNPTIKIASNGVTLGTGANSFLQLGNGASSFGCGIWFSADNSSNSWLIDCYDYGASRFSLAQSTGAGAIGSSATERLYVANGGTSWTAASDETVKDITGEFVGALDQVAKSRTVRGAYKYDPDTKHSFLIAQDWQDYLPEAISVGNDGKLGLSYVETIPVAFAAIKELIAKIEALEARLAALEAK